jgi:hypothetical protein
MHENISTTQAIELFDKALAGQNFSPKTIRAYHDDLAQIAKWLASIINRPGRLG